MSPDGVTAVVTRRPRALITGYTGQDGTFLTKLLLDKGYRVIGLVRRVSTEPPTRVRGQFDFSAAIKSRQLVLVEGDLQSLSSLIDVVREWRPNEVYNLAAQSHVGVSFKQPELTIEANLIGVVNLITALNAAGGDNWRMYQASTSEMFGQRNFNSWLREIDELRPVSPYAIAKTAAHHYCQMTRTGRDRFISCGILFNHESEIRGGDFVTQKIARFVADFPDDPGAYLVDHDALPQLDLGNLDAKRDWGYAGDYVEAMWLMLQHDRPDDFVIATSVAHSVRDFVNAAFKVIGHKVSWGGEGAAERGLVNGREVIRINPSLWRPAEVGYLRGNPTKATEQLGWRPKVTFEELVELMVKGAKESRQ